jgi:thiamine biosynthesis lipoprotein
MKQGAASEHCLPVRRHASAMAAAALLFVTLTAAGQQITPGGGSATSARARYLMGTRLVIECTGEVAPQVFDAAFEEVGRLESILSNWLESSELSHLNREGIRAPFPVSADLMHAVEVSLKWAERTEGAFDPTVESLMRRYGLRDGNALADDPAPAGGDRSGTASAEEGSRPPAVVGWRHVVVDSEERAIHFTKEGIGIDLGGIGKGIALDEAAKVLAGRGVAGGLLDFGGQVLAMGEPGAEDGWLIGVTDPAQRERTVATVTLRAGSLATSGNGERAMIEDEGIVGHILNPRAAAPARFTGSVSVLAASGTTADALSTALFVMGPARGYEWAEDRGIAALYIWRDVEGGLEFLATSAMRPDVDWGSLERSTARGT